MADVSLASAQVLVIDQLCGPDCACNAAGASVGSAAMASTNFSDALTSLRCLAAMILRACPQAEAVSMAGATFAGVSLGHNRRHLEHTA